MTGSGYVLENSWGVMAQKGVPPADHREAQIRADEAKFAKIIKDNGAKVE